ncbi:MFS transporter [bacterium]|nr:MFS transporter [bacterium]
MIADQKTKNWKQSILLKIAGFYLFQGFYFTALGLYKDNFLVENGLNPGTFALVTALLILPNYLKMLLVIVSDRFPIKKLRRKPYILIGAVLYIPCFAGLILTHNEEAITWSWVFFVIMTGWVWVLVDGTLDALTVDVTPDNKMGIVQGSTWGARGIGSVLGALVIMMIGTSLGWKVGLAIVGLFAILQALFGLLIKERRVEKKDLPEFTSLLKETFTRKEVLMGLLFVVVAMTTTAPYMFFIPLFGGDGVVTLTKSQLGIAYALAMIGTFFGATIFGKISDMIGARKTFTICAILYWIGVSLFLLIDAQSDITFCYMIVAVFGMNLGAFMAPVNRISMELSEAISADKPGIEGFMFSTFSSVSNFGTAAFGGLIIGFGTSFLDLGLTSAFFLVFPLTLTASVLLKYVDPWVPSKT